MNKPKAETKKSLFDPQDLEDSVRLTLKPKKSAVAKFVLLSNYVQGGKMPPAEAEYVFEQMIGLCLKSDPDFKRYVDEHLDTAMEELDKKPETDAEPINQPKRRYA